MNESDQTEETPYDYWLATRRPLNCLLFLLPWIAVYEVGVSMLSAENSEQIRNGADYWLRSLLSVSGFHQAAVLPLSVVAVLLAWHIIRQYPWQIRLETQLGMLAESLLLAVALVAVGQVHHLLFLNLQVIPPSSVTLSAGNLRHAVTYIGAGVYEEVLFRLLLVPVAFSAFRLLEFPSSAAAALAALSTGFIFALAHHVGPSADAFNLFAFSFRTAAGVFFAGVFFVRGFGITVGCHAGYDLLVGVFLAGS